MLSWGTECAVLFWVGPPGVAWGAAAELQLSSYAMGWCVGFEGGFWVVLRGLRVVAQGFEVAISCGVGCRNCAELG